jgi:steroid delta-isomerase-like uncharacterized protein
MSIEKNRIFADRFIAIFNEPNLDIVEEIFAPNFRARLMGDPNMSRQSWKEIVGVFRAGFPDVFVEVGEVIATEDRVVIRCILKGTHQGEFFGVPPTNKEVAWSGTAWFDVKDGVATDHWGEMNILGLMQQIGAIPVPGQAA